MFYICVRRRHSLEKRVYANAINERRIEVISLKYNFSALLQTSSPSSNHSTNEKKYPHKKIKSDKKIEQSAEVQSVSILGVSVVCICVLFSSINYDEFWGDWVGWFDSFMQLVWKLGFYLIYCQLFDNLLFKENYVYISEIHMQNKQ